MRQISILDPRFRYVPSIRTDVATTWRRFGFRVGNAGQPRSVSDFSETECSPVALETRHDAQPGERSNTSPYSLGKSARC